MEVASNSPFPLSWLRMLVPEPQWLSGTSGYRNREKTSLGEETQEEINQVDR